MGSEAAEELLCLGFAKVIDTPQGPRLYPVDPDVALPPLDRYITERAEKLARRHAHIVAVMPQLRAAYRRQQPGSGQIRALDGHEVSPLIEEILEATTTELLVAQPRKELYRADLVNEAMDRDLAAFRRGVKARTIYVPAQRASTALGTYVAEIQKQGAEVRTLGTPFSRVLIFDRERAIINDVSAPEPSEGGRTQALLVEDPRWLAHLVADFERTWALAMPWTIGSDEDELTQEEQFILRCIAAGVDRGQIATRMGVSRHVINKHVTIATRKLRARDGYHAIALWMAMQSQPLPPEKPEWIPATGGQGAPPLTVRIRR